MYLMSSLINNDVQQFKYQPVTPANPAKLAKPATDIAAKLTSSFKRNAKKRSSKGRDTSQNPATLPLDGGVRDGGAIDMNPPFMIDLPDLNAPIPHCQDPNFGSLHTLSPPDEDDLPDEDDSPVLRARHMVEAFNTNTLPTKPQRTKKLQTFQSKSSNDLGMQMSLLDRPNSPTKPVVNTGAKPKRKPPPVPQKTSSMRSNGRKLVRRDDSPARRLSVTDMMQRQAMQFSHLSQEGPVSNV